MSKLNNWLIIMIIYDKNMFSVNNSQKKIWTLDNYSILRPKNRTKDIMVFNFLLLWSKLNFFSLSPEK